MKILHIDIAFVQGGIHNMLVEIMGTQRSLGHDVKLIVLNDDINENVFKRIPLGITAYFIKRPTGSVNPWYVLKLFWIIRKISPDVIHCHNAVLGKIVRFFKIPSVLTVHDIGMVTKGCCYFDVTSAISKSVFCDIKKTCYKVNATVVYNGVDFKPIRFKPHYKENGCKNLIVICRIVHVKKGLDLLLDALEIMYHKGVKNWSLDIIGDGPSMQFLIDKVKKNGLESRISFKGEKSKKWINTNLCLYDAFLMTSRYEGFGITVIEAIGAGLEILSSDIDGPAEILENGKYGHMFKSGDIDSLVSSLTHIISINHEEKKCTKENREYIVKKYSIENTTNNYLKIYQKLIHNGNE